MRQSCLEQGYVHLLILMHKFLTSEFSVNALGQTVAFISSTGDPSCTASIRLWYIHLSHLHIEDSASSVLLTS